MSEQMVIAASALIAVVVIALAALKGWQGWLDLRRLELSAPQETGSPEGRSRIELADLKERIRKLEAIASGVDL